MTVEGASADAAVLTTAYSVSTYPNVTLEHLLGVGQAGRSSTREHLHRDTFAGARVVRWHRTHGDGDSCSSKDCSDGALETAYNMFELASPTSQAHVRSASWGDLEGVSCSGEDGASRSKARETRRRAPPTAPRAVASAG